MKLTRKWWFLIVAIPIIGLCVYAGFWQLERAVEKEQLIQRLTEGSHTIVNASDYISADVGVSTYRVNLWVTRGDEDVLYLDNRIQDRVAGYDVLAQYFLEETDVAVWINLGWVPGGVSRASLPLVSLPNRFKLKGLLIATPESFRMTNAHEERFDSRIRVQSLGNAIDRLVFAENALDRKAVSPKPRLSTETHYGYAVQWFLMALVLSGMTVYVFRRSLN